jgi:hypothetical protein
MGPRKKARKNEDMTTKNTKRIASHINHDEKDSEDERLEELVFGGTALRTLQSHNVRDDEADFTNNLDSEVSIFHIFPF